MLTARTSVAAVSADFGEETALYRIERMGAMKKKQNQRDDENEKNPLAPPADSLPRVSLMKRDPSALRRFALKDCVERDEKPRYGSLCGGKTRRLSEVERGAGGLVNLHLKRCAAHSAEQQDYQKAEKAVEKNERA